MNHEDSNNLEHQSHGQDTDLEIEIPELTQQIPVVDQVIPELTVRAEEAQLPVAEPQLDIPELTEPYIVPEETVPDIAEHQVEVYPVTTSQISDQELELQQWQIEQQAEIQAGEWYQVASMDSVILPEPEAQFSPRESVAEVTLTDDQQALVDASWQRLETLIMEQMPVELAGIYLTLLEQQLDANRAQIAEAIQLLEADTLDHVLDYFQIERGF
jgi:hypothetical protein